MYLEQITDFFKWMTIINVGLLCLSSGLVMMLKGIMCRLHGKLFGIKEESVAVIAYGYLGLYKILVIVFCLVPYVSLQLIK